MTDDLQNMWKTAYKLTKTFGDLPGPRRIAESIRAKIDKFKQHLAVLVTICNPGIKDRHWDQVGGCLWFMEVLKNLLYGIVSMPAVGLFNRRINPAYVEQNIGHQG